MVDANKNQAASMVRKPPAFTTFAREFGVEPLSSGVPAAWVRVLNGILPSSIEEATEVLTMCRRGDRTLLNIEWMTLARAKPFFPSPAAWLDWAQSETTRYKSRASIHHAYTVGAFMIKWALGREGDVYGLFTLEFDKILCISRLDEHLVPTFFARNQAHVLARSSVRTIVNRYLVPHGGPEDDRPEPSEEYRKPRPQLCFFDTLLAVAPASQADLQELQEYVHRTAPETIKDATTARSMLLSGMIVTDAMIDLLAGPILTLVAEQLNLLSQAAVKRSMMTAGTSPHFSPVSPVDEPEPPYTPKQASAAGRGRTLLGIPSPKPPDAVFTDIFGLDPRKLYTGKAPDARLNPVCPLSPPADSTVPALTSPENFVRKKLPSALAGYTLSGGKVIPPPEPPAPPRSQSLTTPPRRHQAGPGSESPVT